MIDGIIDALQDIASPALTRWRSFFFLLSIFFTSPGIVEFYSENFASLTLQSSAAIFADVFAASKLICVIPFLILYYFISPYMNSVLLMRLIRFNMGYAGRLTDKLDEVRGLPQEKLEEIIRDTYEDRKISAIKSENTISKYNILSEVSMMLSLFYISTSLILNVFNIFVLVFVLFASFIFCHVISRKILLEYLSNIAPFKVLDDYVKNIFLVK